VFMLPIHVLFPGHCEHRSDGEPSSAALYRRVGKGKGDGGKDGGEGKGKGEVSRGKVASWLQGDMDAPDHNTSS